MSKSREEVKRELIEELEQIDMSRLDIEYIIGTVSFVDDHMRVKKDEKATVGKQVDKMVDLCRRIQQGKTGVPEIDEYIEKRRQIMLDSLGNFKDDETLARTLDVTPSPYVFRIIESISENGGLMRYAKKQYNRDINTPYDKEPEPLEEIPAEESKTSEEVQADLLDDLEMADIPKSELVYIQAMVKYVDEQMQVPEEEKAIVGVQMKRMGAICSRVQEGQTGVSEIDEIKERRREASLREMGGMFKDGPEIVEKMSFETTPYVDDLIACISPNGGYYSIKTEDMAKEAQKEKRNSSMDER